MTVHAALTGWGHYLPATVLSNDTLAATVNTTDEWIWSRTGIRERRIAAPGETTSSMCTAAAIKALDRAGMNAASLDLVICATMTPDRLLPATSCVIREQLGARSAGAFDLNSACTGFVGAYITAAQFIQAGTCSRVLVVAGETLSRFVDWKDRGTCILFGDGAGAAVLEADHAEGGVRGAVLGCRGDLESLLTIEAGGAARPATSDTVALGSHYIKMQGNEVFRLAVRTMRQAAEQATTQAGVPLGEVDHVIAHQANLRILQRTQEVLGIPAEKMYINVDRYGNTGAASVAIALSELADTGVILPGQHVLMVAFGGGLTWAGMVVRWADLKAITARRRGAPLDRCGWNSTGAAPFGFPGLPNERRLAG